MVLAKGLRIWVAMLSLPVLFFFGCETVDAPVRRYHPSPVVSPSAGVREMGRHLGVCPEEEPSRPVYGLLLEGSGTCDRRPEAGLGCGRLGGEIDVAVILVDGDRSQGRSRAWIPSCPEIKTDGGSVRLAGELGERLFSLGCVGRRELSACQSRVVSDLSLGLQVRLGSVSVLPIVFDGPGMSRTLVGGIMEAMFSGRVLLIGVLPSEYMSRFPDWSSRLSSVVTAGWHGQRVGVAGMAALEIFRQFGFSPLLLEGRCATSSRRVRVLSFLETPQSSGVMELGRRSSWPAGEVLREVSRHRGTVELGYEGDVLNETEGRILLSVVRMSLNRTVRKQSMKVSEVPQYSPRFAEPYGAVIRLVEGNRIVSSASSLGTGKALMLELLELCRQLAQDRQSPLNESVLNRCRLEVGVIPPPRRLHYTSLQDLYGQLEGGRHGVIVRHGGKAAGFLPWVWDEFHDAGSFLRGVCRRGGMAPGVLSDQGCEVRVFEVIWFKEPGLGERGGDGGAGE